MLVESNASLSSPIFFLNQYFSERVRTQNRICSRKDKRATQICVVLLLLFFFLVVLVNHLIFFLERDYTQQELMGFIVPGIKSGISTSRSYILAL